jgi:hypothetical protein
MEAFERTQPPSFGDISLTIIVTWDWGLGEEVLKEEEKL